MSVRAQSLLMVPIMSVQAHWRLMALIVPVSTELPIRGSASALIGSPPH
jgi:hypothetical protein